MFVDLSQNLILMTAGAFLIGWLLSSIFGSLGSKSRAKKRDPRDDRIRSLEAELRVAQTDLGQTREKVEELEKSTEGANDGIEKRDNVISHQQERMEEMSVDLKESVIMTRRLRAELSDRATENIKSEVKIRDIETELEVAQASTDMIATGVLDYSLAPTEEGGENDDQIPEDADVTKAAT